MTPFLTYYVGLQPVAVGYFFVFSDMGLLCSIFLLSESVDFNAVVHYNL